MKINIETVQGEAIELIPCFDIAGSIRIWLAGMNQATKKINLHVTEGSIAFLYDAIDQDTPWKVFKNGETISVDIEDNSEGIIEIPQTFEFPIEFEDEGTKQTIIATFNASMADAMATAMMNVPPKEFVAELSRKITTILYSPLIQGAMLSNLTENAVLKGESIPGIDIKFGLLGLNLKQISWAQTPLDAMVNPEVQKILIKKEIEIQQTQQTEAEIEKIVSGAPVTPTPPTPFGTLKPKEKEQKKITSPAPKPPSPASKPTTPQSEPSTEIPSPKPSMSQPPAPAASTPTPPPAPAKSQGIPAPSPTPSSPPSPAPAKETIQPPSPERPMQKQEEKEIEEEISMMDDEELEAIIEDIEQEIPQKPKQESPQRSRAKAKKRSVSVEVDDFLGEEPLVAPEMDRREYSPLSQKHILVKWYDRMIFQKTYPIEIRVSSQAMKAKASITSAVSGERIQEKSETIEVRREKKVYVRPQFPGCLVSPQQRAFDPSEDEEKVLNFHVTPLTKGTLRPQIEFYQDEELLDSISLDAKIIDHRIAKIVAISGSAVGAIPATFAFLFNVSLEQFFEERISGLEGTLALLIQLGITAALLVSGFGLYQWNNFKSRQSRTFSI